MWGHMADDTITTSEATERDLKNCKSSSRFLKNMLVAGNLMRRDLGQFADKDLADYPYDERALMRLIAHARLDASHSVMNSISDDLAAKVHPLAPDHHHRCIPHQDCLLSLGLDGRTSLAGLWIKSPLL